MGDLPPLNQARTLTASAIVRSLRAITNAPGVMARSYFSITERALTRKSFRTRFLSLSRAKAMRSCLTIRDFPITVTAKPTRLHAKGIGFTVTAHFRNSGSGRFTHYRDNRSITVREAARLQSFDDKFIFHSSETDQERHVGNAVPPLLAKALANHFGAIIRGA
jgi:site-specific DNA-cytosine methylase